MFSGKTGLLIERLASASQFGLETVALKPAVDTRGGSDLLSHTGRTHPAVPWDGHRDPCELVGQARLVAVDEVQFLPATVASALARLREAGLTLVVAGLDFDFRQNAFEPTWQLISSADVVHRLTATCSRCLRPAAFTQRFVNGRPAPMDDDVIRLGADELYQPRCGSCYGAERQLAVEEVP
jgi:thymidine kinase